MGRLAPLCQAVVSFPSTMAAWFAAFELDDSRTAEAATGYLGRLGACVGKGRGTRVKLVVEAKLASRGATAPLRSSSTQGWLVKGAGEGRGADPPRRQGCGSAAAVAAAAALPGSRPP